MPLITESWRAYICERCKLQCDVTGEAAKTGRPLWCPDCPERTQMVPQGGAWTAVHVPEIGMIGSRGSLLECLTALTNAVIDIRNILEANRDPFDASPR